MVFFMQAGFALLEAGSVRYKNMQNVLLKNIMDTCISAFVWWAIGFAFAYGEPDKNGFLGTKYFFGIGVGDSNKYGFWFLSYVFAANSTTIVSGALAERCKINTYLCFAVLMMSFIYPIICAWTWGGGFMKSMGFYDFAGSGVIHLTGGVASFIGAFIIGPRLGKFNKIRTQKLDYDIEATNNAKGNYSGILKKFDDGSWDMLRVNQFVRDYQTMLAESDIDSANNPSQVCFGVLILWLGWLMFNGLSTGGITGELGK